MDRLQFRRDTAARWAEVNPILLEGEIGYEIDTKMRKVGDGVTAWNKLAYLKAENISQSKGTSENAVMSQAAVTELLDEGYKYIGVATTTTTPITPSVPAFYIAMALGTYSGFNNLTLAQGEVALFKHNGTATGTWTKETLSGVMNKNSVVQGKGTSTTNVMSQKSITDLLNAGYEFIGVASLTTNPSTPTVPSFYIATYEGDYTNFNLSLAAGEVAIFKHSGIVGKTWVKETIDILNKSSVTQDFGGSELKVMNQRTLTSEIYDTKNKIGCIISALPNGTLHELSIDWNTGYYSSPTEVIENLDWQCCRIDAPFEYKYILFSIFGSENRPNLSGDECIIRFVDDNDTVISANFPPRNIGMKHQIPENTSKILINNRISSGEAHVYFTNMDECASKDDVLSLINSSYITNSIVSEWIEGEYYKIDGTIASVSTYSRSEPIDISQYVGKTLKMNSYTTGNAAIIIKDINDSIIKVFAVEGYYEYVIPADAKYIYISNRMASIPSPYYVIDTIELAKVLTEEDKTEILEELNSFRDLNDNLFSIEQLQLSEWILGEYYNSNGEIESTSTWARQEVNIEAYRNKILYCKGVSKYGEYGGWCLIKDVDGNILLKFQFDTQYKVYIPDTAVTLLLSNRWQSDSNPYYYTYQTESDLIKVETQNNLQGKKVAFIGDSITAAGGYIRTFGNLYGCNSVNYGVSSTCIADNTSNGQSANRFVTRATAENLSDSNLIVVFGGTNDFSYDIKAIGNLFIETNRTAQNNIGDKTITAPSDTETFAGALHELITTIRTNAPTVPIVFITPLRRGRYTSINPTSLETNKNGDFMKDFATAIKEICSFYSIPVLDLFSVSELDFTNTDIATKYSSDTLHPNSLGHTLIGNLLFRFVENNVIIL